MKKRDINDVLDAIAAAAAETQGRTLAQIDHAADAATAAARKLVSITLEDYAPYPGADPGGAEWRYRKEIERALGGALGVAQAFQAFLMARESEPEELSETERRLAAEWIAAMPRAHAAGVDGLVPALGAWFEVRRVRQDPPAIPQRSDTPVQGDLF